MRSSIIAAAAGTLLLAAATTAPAQDLVEIVVNGCEKELTSYCSNVTPGEGRVLSCLYAYGDKLSGKCEFALYDAAAQLERAVAALSYVANECDADIDNYCASVMVGEGRILACLNKNESKIAPRCNQALKDVGLK
jgi:hypothetical protein